MEFVTLFGHVFAFVFWIQDFEFGLDNAFLFFLSLFEKDVFFISQIDSIYFFIEFFDNESEDGFQDLENVFLFL